MPTRRSGARRSTRSGRSAASGPNRSRAFTSRSSTCSTRESTRRGRPSTTTATPVAPRARSRTSSRSTCAKASPVRVAAHASRRSARQAAARTSARIASARLGGREADELVERAVAVGFQQFPEAADHALAGDDLGKGHLARALHETGPAIRVLGEADLFVVHATALQQSLRLTAKATRIGGVDGYLPAVRHAFLRLTMPGQGTFKTEGVVLRSIRLGEADRVLHLYTEDRGRLGAVAKGVRKVKSRFGGRLEPFSRVKLILHEGRSDLCTVTAADTVHAHATVREGRESINCATDACDAVLKLFDAAEPNAAAYNLLCHELALIDQSPQLATVAQALAFRMKLLLAAGFVPELSACASCGEREHLGAFSAAAGGVVCPGCEAGSFALDEEAHTFMVEALAKPLADAPDAPPFTLRQVDRVVSDTVEYHGHVRLRRLL